MNTDTLALWNKVKTPPNEALSDYTKQQDQKALTSVNLYYTLQLATEIFGPYGIGWGYEEIESRIDDGAPIANGKAFEKIVSKRIRFWYLKDGQKITGLDNWGSAYILCERNGALQSNREAHTSAISSALSKILSMLGFNADVYQDKVKHPGAAAAATQTGTASASTAAPAPGRTPAGPVSSDGWCRPLPTTEEDWTNYNSQRTAEIRGLATTAALNEFETKLAPALAALARFKPEWHQIMCDRLTARRTALTPAIATHGHKPGQGNGAGTHH